MQIISESFTGLVGFLMPYVVEIVKSKLPKTKGRWLGYVLSYGICVLVGGISSLAEGAFDPENVLSAVGTGLIVSQGVYNLYFKPNGVDVRMQKILR